MKPADSFWGEITSSVDFCEANFEFSPYCAEPANAVSSLVLTILGLAGLLGAKRNEVHINAGSRWHDCAFAAMYGTLAIIGLGSVALHTTLSSWGQALDEVPMLLLAIFILATLLELPASEGGLARPRLPAYTVVACVVTVLVYTTFRAFYMAFLICYISCVVVIVLRMGSLALRPRKKEGKESIRVAFIRPFFLGGVLSYICCGSFAWFTDFLLCDAISRRLGLFLGTAVLHPLWHVGAGVGTFLAIQVLAAARAEAIGATPVLRWLAGVLPYVMFKPCEEKKGGPQSLGATGLRPLVLLCGPSGCGKSSLAAALASAAEASGLQCSVVSQDNYFTHRFESYQERADDRFEGPAHIDWAALRRDTAAARQRSGSSGSNQSGERCGSRPGFCCVEGHVLATDEVLAAAASFAVVFEGAEATCRSRRLGRRPRPDEERRVLEKYIVEFVWPAFLRYGRPAQDALEEQLLLRSPGGRGRRCCLRIAREDARTPEELAKDVLQALGNSGLV